MKAIDFIVNAKLLYKRYLETQVIITEIETAAMKAARGNKRAAAYLLNPREDTDQSFIYKNLCSDRDQFMKRAQLEATMAILLKAVE